MSDRAPSAAAERTQRLCIVHLAVDGEGRRQCRWELVNSDRSEMFWFDEMLPLMDLALKKGEPLEDSFDVGVGQNPSSPS